MLGKLMFCAGSFQIHVQLIPLDLRDQLKILIHR